MVAEGLAQAGKGIGYAVPGEPLAQRPQGVDHARHAGVPAKKDEPAVLLIHHPLIVDQCAALLEQSSQHGHVVGLALDHVGKKDIGRVWLKLLFGDLFDAKDDGAGGYVVPNRNARLRELLFGEGSGGRSLHHYLYPMGALQFGSILGRYRHSPFPLALVFPTDADHCRHGHSLLWP